MSTDVPLDAIVPTEVYAFTYADGLTFPSVLTPFHWLSLMPMILAALVLTAWTVYTKTQFFCLDECFRFLCASGVDASGALSNSTSTSSSKKKKLPVPCITTQVQPVLMPPVKDDMVTIKL